MVTPWFSGETTEYECLMNFSFIKLFVWIKNYFSSVYSVHQNPGEVVIDFLLSYENPYFIYLLFCVNFGVIPRIKQKWKTIVICKFKLKRFGAKAQLLTFFSI